MMNRSLHILSNSIRIGCAVIGLLATTALPMSARCPDTQGNRGLEGHWVITISQPGEKDHFTTLVTFTQDGGMEIFAGYKQTQSIARGTYCRTGDREFTLTMVQLGYKPTLVPKELVPIPIQTELATIRSTIKLNPQGDGFTGPNNVEVVDPTTGQVLFAGDGGKVEGKLVKPGVQ